MLMGLVAMLVLAWVFKTLREARASPVGSIPTQSRQILYKIDDFDAIAIFSLINTQRALFTA